MPVRRTSPRFRVEPLEDRVTPAVTAALDGTTLTVTLGAASDTATITGTTAGGTDLEVAGTGFTTQTFNGVTALVVVDSGGNAGQEVTFADAGAGTAIQLPGAVTVNGIETVTVGTANGDLRALSVGIANAATAINLTAGVTTTGAAGQVYGGPVVVGSASVTSVTLNAGASGGVQFTQTVNGAVADTNSLTVNAGSATTPTRFGGIVGGSVRLATLTTDAAGSTLFAGNVTTNGAQSYGDPVTAAAALVTFTSVSAGVAFLGTLNAQTAGAHGVVVASPFLTNFAAAVGGLAPLSTLTTDSAGTTQLAANVITTGAQAYGDQVIVSGPAVSAVSTGNGTITFTGTLSAAVADTTAVTVNTGGVTTFTAEVGATRLLSLTTDAAGSTRIGTGAAATLAVSTSGAQTFNDVVQLNATAVTFTSTNGGAVLFGAGLNGTSAGTTAVAVNTAGTTTFNAAVGSTTTNTLASLTTDAPGTTVLGASVNTTGAQTYADPVTVTPGTNVTLVMLTASAGAVSFGGTVTGTSAIPFNVRSSGNVTLGGNVTLSGAGSSLTLQAGSSGTGQIVIPAGTTIRADAQAYRAGDGDAASGGVLTTATVNLPATLQMRNAAGTGAPVSFVLRQDESITDATLPNVSQFGGTFPRSIALVSDDGALTLASTAVAGAQTTDLLLSSAQTLTVGTAINAPTATVRLRSSTTNVVQTAAGTITAGTLGVRATTGIDLTLAPNAVTTVALQSTNGDVRYATATPATVGTVSADLLTAVFPVTAGGQTGNGTVTFTPFGTTALDLTVAAPLAGTAASATGGTGADRVTVNYSLGAALPNGFTFTGGDGTDTLILTDTGGATAHTYTVGATVVRDSGQPVNLPGVENLSVTGGDTADTFTVTPDADHTITVAGGNPTTGNGDTLTVTLTGATAPVLTSTRTAGGLQGTGTFGNRQTLTFGGIETLTPSADVRVTATGPSSIRSGESGTLTVVVTNTGPSAVTGQSLVDNFPAGLTATWTAVASAGSSVAATSGTGNINTTADLAVNGTVTFTITLTASGGARGTLTNTFTAGSTASAFELDATNNTATTTITTGPTDIIGVGAGPGGGPVVVALNPDGTERFRRFAFDLAYSGGVTVATGDINGDGFEDIVAGSAVGASRITAFDGRTGNELATFFAFPGFTGGVNVAVAGGKIVAGAGFGGGPVVAVFTLGAGGIQEVNRFLAFGGDFRGGVQVGGSDRFLAVGAGPGGGPHGKLFDAATFAQTASFFAFPVGSTDGVTVAVGGTSAAPTVIVGSGIGSPPIAATFDAVTLNSLGSFQAFESTFRGGVRVAAGGIVSNKTTTVVAPGGGGSSRVRIVASDNTTVRDFFAFESAFTGGVYVG